MGKAEKKITVRVLLTGMIVVAAIGAGAAYENLMISGSPMTFDYSAAAALFFFTPVGLGRYGRHSPTVWWEWT